MKPDLLAVAYGADFPHRIDGVGRRGSHGGAGKERNLPGAPVFINLPGKRARTHGEIVIDVDEPQVFRAQAGDHHAFGHR